MKIRQLIAMGSFVLVAVAPFFAQADPVDPYKFVIISDHESIPRAEAAVALIKSTYPFSQMGNQVVFEIKEANPKKMNCKGNYLGIDRLISCDASYIFQEAASVGPHRVLVTTSSAVGGAGGTGAANGPLAIAGAGYSVPTLLHELLHTYGLADEYEYTESEANTYCKENGHPAPNSVSFEPRLSYASDAEARSIHGGQIPWYGDILLSTLITTGSELGSSPVTGLRKVFSGRVAGLFRGGNCNKKVPTWKPYFEDNIMKNHNVVDIPPIHAKAIVRAMSAERGADITLLPPPPIESSDARVNQGNSKNIKHDQSAENPRNPADSKPAN